MISIILITHGVFGQELLRTAQDIIGRQEGVAALAKTADMGAESLAKAVEDTMGRLQASEGTLFLVDMLGGTPCNTAMMRTRDKNAEIVTGVNLYMALSSFRHRESMDLKALAAKVAEDGRRAIVLPKDLLAKKINPR